MEVSLIGSSQAKDLVYKNVGFCNFSNNWSNLICSRKSRVGFVQSSRWSKAVVRLSLRVSAAATEHHRSVAAVSEKVSSHSATSHISSMPMDGVRLYVGLPLDSVSDCNSVNHARAISAGLKALKLLGVDGVELPIWWGVAEKEAMGKYEWSGYLALVEMIQKVGLKLHVSLNFHASKQPNISLPLWVSRIGESQPSIFFTDRSGKHYKECLSLAVDDLPVLDGKTPIQIYKDFCGSFKATFLPFMGSTITGISIGLGPDGELRYPSHHHSAKSASSPGAGEFQCYDQNMINHLKQHAQASGNPLWGLSGPHDAPSYDQQPICNTFFKEQGGSWETPYGDFFLSWYSSQLISHGNRILSLASSSFTDTPVAVSGKVPLIHSWYKTRSHPSELTAGFYNTVNRDGYEAIVDVFKRNSCKMILPGMDLLDDQQANESLSSPESLLQQITNTCRKHGVNVSGQNVRVSGAPEGFEQIKKNLSRETGMVDLFLYQRMGAEFFSPDHFPSFTAFVRSLDQPQLHSDDLATNEGETSESLTGKDLQVQTA